MFLAFFALAALPQLMPARWASNDVDTLSLLRDTPINCLLIEESLWSERFNREAANRGIATFGVIRPAGQAVEAAQKLAALQFTGVALEGAFEPSTAERLRRFITDSKLRLVELTSRGQMRFDTSASAVGTFQGLWPGIQVQEDGAKKAAPSGAPWIDTNAGFLRFVRASTKAAIWMGYTPPAGAVQTLDRYLQAVADAAMNGARWIVALDPEFNRKLYARDPETLKDWAQIMNLIRHFERPEWREAQPFARMALVEDVASGALLSGGILDMIAVKHTPVRPVPPRMLDHKALLSATMAVNVDPASLNDQQKAVLTAFTRAGGTLLSGPPGWKFPSPRPDQIVLEKDDLKKLDEIWRELNALTGRKNLGARLFNVSSMLSNLLESPDGKQIILHLVNYSGYPIENVTVHVLGKYKLAQVVSPNAPARELTGYEIDEGTGFDLDRVGAAATLLLTR